MVSRLRSYLDYFRGRVSSSDPYEVERAEWAFYLSYLKEGMIVVDAGAYFGELTLLFSHFVGESGKVYSFEANQRAFEKLEIVSMASARRNIVLNHAALFASDGELELKTYDDRHLSWSTLAERPLEDYGIKVKPVGLERVRTVSLDTYCREHNIERVDLLKLDVEGAEYQAMVGAAGMFARKEIGCCIFEFGQTTFDMGNHPDEIEAFVHKRGYKIRNIMEGQPAFPGKESAASARFSMHVATPV